MKFSDLLRVLNIISLVILSSLYQSCSTEQGRVNCALLEENYTVFESLLLERSNLINLEDALYPTNHPYSSMVDVYYHFTAREDKIKIYSDDSVVITKEDHRILQQDNSVKFRWLASPINLYIRPDLLKRLSLWTYQVKPNRVDIVMKIPCTPEQTQKIIAEGGISKHNTDSRKEQSDDAGMSDTSGNCSNLSTLLHQLNNMTANLRSYALHRSSVMSRGMQLDTEKGYSVYYFGDKESDYCVIDQDNEYYQQRLNMNVGSIVLVVCIMLAIPLIFVTVHDNFCKKMTKNKNMLFFVWSTLVVAASCALPILILDVMTYVYNINFYSSGSFNDIHTYFILFISLIGVVLVLNLVTLAASLAYLKHKDTDEIFPIPKILKFISDFLRKRCCCVRCCSQERTEDPQVRTGDPQVRTGDTQVRTGDPQERTGDPQERTEDCQERTEDPQVRTGDPQARTGDSQARTGDSQVRTGDPQERTGDPQETGGTFLELCWSDCIVLLIAMYLFMLFLQLMSFHSVYIVLGTIATPVKTLSLTTFYIALFFSLVAFVAVFLKATDDIDYNQRCERKEKVCILMKCLLPLFAVGLFAVCAFFFVRYFSNYLTVIQGSNNSVGILSVLGSILPSALIGLAGFCGTRIMNCIGTNNEEEEKLKHLSSLLERLSKEETIKVSAEDKRLKEENDKALAKVDEMTKVPGKVTTTAEVYT